MRRLRNIVIQAIYLPVRLLQMSLTTFYYVAAAAAAVLVTNWLCGPLWRRAEQQQVSCLHLNYWICMSVKGTGSMFTL